MELNTIVYVAAHEASVESVGVGHGRDIVFLTPSSGFNRIEGIYRVAAVIIERKALRFLDDRWWQAINVRSEQIVII